MIDINIIGKDDLINFTELEEKEIEPKIYGFSLKRGEIFYDKHKIFNYLIKNKKKFTSTLTCPGFIPEDYDRKRTFASRIFFGNLQFEVSHRSQLQYYPQRAQIATVICAQRASGLTSGFGCVQCQAKRLYVR